MFSIKRNIPVKCDDYINLYDNCNIGCNHCKFHQIKNNTINEIAIDYSKYYNKKILFCYSVDPYPLNQDNKVRSVIKQLHKQNCSIVFLTRRASELYQDLDIFLPTDYIGISLSENCDQNSTDHQILKLYQEAKKRNIKTWMSLEPVYTSKYVNEIVDKYGDYIDFIRVGKDDLITYDWESIKKDIIYKDNVYIK